VLRVTEPVEVLFYIGRGFIPSLNARVFTPTFEIKKKPRLMSEAAVVGELKAKQKEDTKTKEVLSGKSPLLSHCNPCLSVSGGSSTF
jgi:hypothetical protein